MARKRCILVGVGGWGRAWVNRFLPAFRERLDVVALADIDREALTTAGARLGVPGDRCFVDPAEAIRRTDADFCVLVVQPHLRAELVELATARGMDVLGEKPVAHTWESSLAVRDRVRSTGQKMAVIQNYRFLPAFVRARELLAEGRVGAINYINARFAVAFTPENAGGAFRHQIPDAMLYEGAVHHLDQLRNLAGAECARVSGRKWNPSWSRFANSPCALFQLEMANSVMCQYEFNNVGFGQQKGWHSEEYRIECERGSIVVEGSVVRVHEYHGDPGSGVLRTDTMQIQPAPDSGHHRIIEDFLGWLDKGPAPETALEANLGTAALTFGAVEAANTGEIVDVSAMLSAAGVPSPRRTRSGTGVGV